MSEDEVGVSVNYLKYDLQNGYVHNWLVAGPQATPVANLADILGDDLKPRVAHRFYRQESGIADPPAEGKPFELDGEEPNAIRARWEYYRCLDDHFVDFTRYYPGCNFLRSWAYTQVASPLAREMTLTITTNGPADVWLNNQHVHRQEGFSDQIPRGASFTATLIEGHNEVLVRFEGVAIRECPHVMALRMVPSLTSVLDQHADLVSVTLPTLVDSVDRRQSLESMFEAAYLERDVYVRDDEIVVKLPDGMTAADNAVVRLQTPTSQIHFESMRLGPSTGNDASLGRAYEIPEGRFEAFLMPPLQDYYQANMRLHRKIGLWAATNHFASAPYGTFEQRRLEALEDAARRDQGVFSEIAKMALDRWSIVRTEALFETIAAINRREDGSDRNLLALLGMIHRYQGHAAFPPALREPLEQCVLGFKYWLDEPGQDPMDYSSESHQILFHACEVLAGQLYPTRTFINAAQSGLWHREKGEQLTISWLQERGASGFREWDSTFSFAQSLVALSHLADLTTTPQVYNLAAVVTDKLLFSMALNSFRGVFGSTQGRATTREVKSGRLQATAGVSRLLWGVGVFNEQTMATVSLACSESYTVPLHLEAIATDLPEEMWSRERHGGSRESNDRMTGCGEVNKVTYRTPDSMLCSAQDYHPGERGSTEHIWQATLGPDAVVFVNHPACSSEDPSHRPSYWAGNTLLPRVAQWKDVLIAVYRQPVADGLGFTHAFFPTHAFDESAQRVAPIGQPWAFARKGDGYLALTAARGLVAVASGDNAYRELRSYGEPNVWICHLGRAALDGDFAAFQLKVMSLDVFFEDLSVRCSTLRGETLEFGWEGPLLRDGQEQPITGFQHYDNRYCVAELPSHQLDIRFGDQILRLSFV